jgi:maltose alpha-D-glucosyltransferase/alpha-amylase
MHLALASGDDAAFRPESFNKLYQRSLYQSMRVHARRTLSLLRKRKSSLPATAVEAANLILEHEETVLQRLRQVAEQRIHAQRIRCHGDFHLGQVLFTGKDFVIIDFEGEPSRPIGERRIKASPIRDVAGMIRSFHYAAHAASRAHQRDALLPSASSFNPGPWATVWFVWTSAAFLKAYLAEVANGNILPPRREELEILLNAYLLEKAVYELNYELNNRPDWVSIPMEGILHLLQAEPHPVAEQRETKRVDTNDQ